MGLGSFLKTAVKGVTGFISGGPIGAIAAVGSSLANASASKKATAAENAAINLTNERQVALMREQNALQEKWRAEERNWALDDRQWLLDNSGTDFNKLKQDALDAGFNPLTALGSGAVGSYAGPAISPQAVTSGTAVGAPSLIVPQIGVSSSSFIGDALNTVANHYERQADRTADFETRKALLHEESQLRINEMKHAAAGYSGAGYSIDRVVAGAGTLAKTAYKKPNLAKDDALTGLPLDSKGPKEGAYTNRDDIKMPYAKFLGWDIWSNPDTSDIALSEDRRGDNLATELMGIGATINDINYSAHRNAAAAYKAKGGKAKGGYKPSTKMDALGLNVGIPKYLRDAYKYIGW